jgi:hypothetical protein
MGIFADHLKYATVKSLYKKGDKSCMMNYIPTSLLTESSKVFSLI